MPSQVFFVFLIIRTLTKLDESGQENNENVEEKEKCSLKASEY